MNQIEERLPLVFHNTDSVRMLKQSTLKKINQPSIYFDKNKWDEWEMNKVCPLIKEWNIQCLNLTLVFNAQIFTQVKNVSFLRLRSLKLHGNQICSIEALHQIQMPELQEIEVHNNRLENIKEFNKCHNKKLKTLVIWDNFVKEAHLLTKVPFQNIYDLEVDPDNNIIEISDISWICKLECTQMQIIYINNEQRIFQKRLFEAIQRKYTKIQFNIYKDPYMQY